MRGNDVKFLIGIGCCYIVAVIIAIVSVIVIVEEHSVNQNVMSCSFEHTENCNWFLPFVI